MNTPKHTVNIRIDSGAHRRLKIMAAKKGITLTALITEFSKYKELSAKGYTGYSGAFILEK